MAPHGNSKRNQRPFVRTQTSTLESIKENLPSMSPKQILSQSYEKAGGVLQIKSSGEVGRNLRQVYNLKNSQSCASGLTSNCNKDLVYDLLEQHYCSERNFVRNVHFDDSVMSLVGFDQQFADLERFCACDDPVNSSILGIDPTFNLGDFYVTPTVYENKLLINSISGNHPTFIGPTLIHQDRKYESYYYFASQIKKMRPGMDGLVALGTDGEEALSSAFLAVFPRAIHLLCSIHKRDNITRKLRDFNVKECGIKQILSDVFGTKSDDTLFPGLVDSTDSSDFAEKLELLKPKWNSICPAFFEWFMKQEAQLICSSMIACVRTRAGLGKPPKCFTTNSSESVNNLLKRKVDFKRSEWPHFNKVLRTLVDEQNAEFQKAIFGEGEYEFAAEFKHLQVPNLDWMQMTPDQRKLRIEKAYKATLNSSKSMVQSGELHVSKCRMLSMEVKDAKLEHLSVERVKDMWEKAEELLSTAGLVLPAAGVSDSARQVASLSSYKKGNPEAPHYVTVHKRKVGTEVKCNCPVYRSSPNICQHALATAEDLCILSEYMHWVRRTKKSVNLSQLIADAVPKTGGQKNTCKRKGGPKRKSAGVITHSCDMPVSTRSQTESTSYSFSAPSSVSFGAHFPCSSVTYSMHAPLPSSTPYLYPSFPPMTTNMYPFSSSYPGFQIQSPMYAHSIDMYSNYNFSENSLQDIDSSKADQPVVFYLHWLSGTTIRICYGCANPIRDNTSIVPPPPHDIVVRFKERRYYRDPTVNLFFNDRMCPYTCRFVQAP